MGEQCFTGVSAGYLGANFTIGPITEWQIDVVKENISHYCEATIDHSRLSFKRKKNRSGKWEKGWKWMGKVERMR